MVYKVRNAKVIMNDGFIRVLINTMSWSSCSD